MFGVHLGRAAEIVVAPDDVQRREGDAADRPAEILAELGILRILGLTFHRDGRWPRLLPSGKNMARTLARRSRGSILGSYQMAISPIVVTGRQDERMPDALERVVYCLPQRSLRQSVAPFEKHRTATVDRPAP